MRSDPAALASMNADTRAQALARYTQLRPFLEDGVPLPQVAAQ